MTTEKCEVCGNIPAKRRGPYKNARDKFYYKMLCNRCASEESLNTYRNK